MSMGHQLPVRLRRAKPVAVGRSLPGRITSQSASAHGLRFAAGQGTEEAESEDWPLRPTLARGCERGDDGVPIQGSNAHRTQ
jgi:hypothetical protein